MSTNLPDYAGAFRNAYQACIYGEVDGQGVDRDAALDYAITYLAQVQASEVTFIPTVLIDALRTAVNSIEPPGNDLAANQAALASVLTEATNVLGAAGTPA
jgi:hypothetical protein